MKFKKSGIKEIANKNYFSTLKMEEYRLTTRRYIPEDKIFHHYVVQRCIYQAFRRTYHEKTLLSIGLHKRSVTIS
jgi:hypothetical protein